ncbi:MAG TPA: SpoIIE family protein phosphatase [Candidatus Binatus sp.]|nr:SpoIIE family protein phosphatase [Candidatus Binatus sp.]
MAELSRDWLEGVVGILETLNQGVIINDDCNHIVYANGHFLQMIGAPASELIGTKVTALFPPEDRPALVKEIERRRREGNNLFEFFLPHRDGSRLPVVITAQQLEDPDGAIFVIVTLTNISAQKRAETALRDANVQLEQRHREIEEDLLLAARVQQSLAPGNLVWGGVAVETFYQPVRTIGGDFGLVAPRPDHLNLMICDVSGHGIGSALVANRIYTETMSQIERGVALAPMMQHLNRFVIGSLRSSVFYFTLVAARLDLSARTLEFAGAGHPPGMIVKPGEAPRLLESRSSVLGLLQDAVDTENAMQVPVASGERVILYTDGFTESFNEKDDMLGVEGLAEIVRETAMLPLPEMTQAIVNRVAAFRRGPAADDMSLVVVEIP